MTTVHDFTVKSIDGSERSLGDYAGKVLLVVNVASACGYTPHYKGLEALYRKYKARGFEVLGFPCNDFGGQEPGTEEEIQTFCSTKYDVTFPLFSKVNIKSEPTAPLYKHLTSDPNGGDVAWNFTKFVVGKDGKVHAHFKHRVAPESAEIVSAIEEALG